MLDYAPDGLIGTSAAPRGQELTVVWKSEGVLDDGALLQLIAVSKSAALGSHATGVQGGRSKQDVFQPERMSGFCASC